MALMKSVLLGSAASLMVVAGAQAADLPTKKGAPAVEYVKLARSAASPVGSSPAPTPA